jgi:sulfur transfer protein SufE
VFTLYSGKHAQEIIDTNALAIFDRIGLRENSRRSAQMTCVR